jgi:anion-transporting  ArsA/GET3 family ATPase
MLLLVSGASGVGKTTARLHARHLLERRTASRSRSVLGGLR